MSNLVSRRRWVRFDERSRGHDLPGRAEAALNGVGARERVHERMVAEPLDRRDLTAVDRVHERDAGERGDAGEQHRAGAAVTFAAGNLRAGQAEVVA